MRLPRPIVLLGLLPVVARGVQQPPVVKQAGNQLEYTADAAGNRLPDFSHAGYGGGGVPLPGGAGRGLVAPKKGEAGTRIQAAIDYVSGLAPDAQGMRGAVQLAAGRYEIAGQLRISASGVVLRGAEGTVLVATGTDRRALVSVSGRAPAAGDFRYKVSDAYVPVGATSLHVAA